MDEEKMAALEQAAEAATADDMLSDEVIEEADEPAESLDSLTQEDEGEAPAEDTQPEQKGTAEPGYVQKRIEKALARERETMRAEIMAQVEAQYAPIKERLLEMDARELVQKGTVKDLETAKELMRYRQGLPAQQEAPARTEQPRHANGQFAPKPDARVEARLEFLADQADKIKAKTGIDVIDIMQSDSDIKNKIMSGEMDFYEVAEAYRPKSSRKSPPAPTRSSNGASGQSPNAIENMTDEQFARMEKKIREGARYSLR